MKKYIPLALIVWASLIGGPTAAQTIPDGAGSPGDVTIPASRPRDDAPYRRNSGSRPYETSYENEQTSRDRYGRTGVKATFRVAGQKIQVNRQWGGGTSRDQQRGTYRQPAQAGGYAPYGSGYGAPQGVYGPGSPRENKPSWAGRDYVGPGPRYYDGEQGRFLPGTGPG